MTGGKKRKAKTGDSAAGSADKSNTGTSGKMAHDVAIESDNGPANGNGGAPNGSGGESDGEITRAEISLILQKTDELRGNIQRLQDDAVDSGERIAYDDIENQCILALARLFAERSNTETVDRTALLTSLFTNVATQIGEHVDNLFYGKQNPAKHALTRAFCTTCFYIVACLAQSDSAWNNGAVTAETILSRLETQIQTPQEFDLMLQKVPCSLLAVGFQKPYVLIFAFMMQFTSLVEFMGKDAWLLKEASDADATVIQEIIHRRLIGFFEEIRQDKRDIEGAMLLQGERQVLELQEMERTYEKREQVMQEAVTRAQDEAAAARQMASEEHSDANQAMQQKTAAVCQDLEDIFANFQACQSKLRDSLQQLQIEKQQYEENQRESQQSALAQESQIEQLSESLEKTNSFITQTQHAHATAIEDASSKVERLNASLSTAEENCRLTTQQKLSKETEIHTLQKQIGEMNTDSAEYANTKAELVVLQLDFKRLEQSCMDATSHADSLKNGIADVALQLASARADIGDMQDDMNAGMELALKAERLLAEQTNLVAHHAELQQKQQAEAEKTRVACQVLVKESQSVVEAMGECVEEANHAGQNQEKIHSDKMRGVLEECEHFQLQIQSHQQEFEIMHEQSTLAIERAGQKNSEYRERNAHLHKQLREFHKRKEKYEQQNTEYADLQTAHSEQQQRHAVEMQKLQKKKREGAASNSALQLEHQTTKKTLAEASARLDSQQEKISEQRQALQTQEGLQGKSELEMTRLQKESELSASQLQTCNAALTSQQAEMADLKKHSKSAQDELQQTVADNQTALIAAEKKHVEAHGVLQQELEQATTRLATAEETNQRQEDVIGEHNKTENESREEISRLQQSVDIATAALDSEKADYAQAVAELQKSLRTATKERDLQKENVTRLNEKISELMNKQAAFLRDADALGLKIDAQEAAMQEQVNEKHRLGIQIHTHQTDIETLQAHMQTMRNEQAIMSQQLELCEGQMGRCADDNKVLAQHVHSLNQVIAKQREEFSEKERQFESNDKIKMHLMAELKAYTAEMLHRQRVQAQEICTAQTQLRNSKNQEIVLSNELTTAQLKFGEKKLEMDLLIAGFKEYASEMKLTLDCANRYLQTLTDTHAKDIQALNAQVQVQNDRLKAQQEAADSTRQEESAAQTAMTEQIAQLESKLQEITARQASTAAGTHAQYQRVMNVEMQKAARLQSELTDANNERETMKITLSDTLSTSTRQLELGNMQIKHLQDQKKSSTELAGLLAEQVRLNQDTLATQSTYEQFLQKFVADSRTTGGFADKSQKAIWDQKIHDFDKSTRESESKHADITHQILVKRIEHAALEHEIQTTASTLRQEMNYTFDDNAAGGGGDGGGKRNFDSLPSVVTWLNPRKCAPTTTDTVKGHGAGADGGGGGNSNFSSLPSVVTWNLKHNGGGGGHDGGGHNGGGSGSDSGGGNIGGRGGGSVLDNNGNSDTLRAETAMRISSDVPPAPSPDDDSDAVSSMNNQDEAEVTDYMRAYRAGLTIDFMHFYEIERKPGFEYTLSCICDNPEQSQQWNLALRHIPQEQENADLVRFPAADYTSIKFCLACTTIQKKETYTDDETKESQAQFHPYGPARGPGENFMDNLVDSLFHADRNVRWNALMLAFIRVGFTALAPHIQGAE